MVDMSIAERLALAAVLLLAYFYVQKAVKENGQEEEVRRMEKKVYTILIIMGLLILAIGAVYLSWLVSSLP
jgi:uncharacterized membrane protein